MVYRIEGLGKVYEKGTNRPLLIHFMVHLVHEVGEAGSILVYSGVQIRNCLPGELQFFDNPDIKKKQAKK